MTNQNPRYLTDDDMARIQELWNRYRSLKKLRENVLPPTANGAWIHDAATHQMRLIADELEQLFAETYPFTPAEVDE